MQETVALDITTSGQENISGILSRIERLLQAMGEAGVRNAKKLDDSSKKSEDSITGLHGSVRSAADAFNETSEAVGRIISGLGQFQQAMADAERRTIAIEAAEARFAGVTDAVGQLSAAAGGLVGNVELAEMANKAALLGQNFGQVERAMEAALAISVQTGEEFRNVFDAIVETAAGTVVSADRYNELTGATLDLKSATEAYAASIGKQASQLSVAEARVAIMPALYRDLDAQIERSTSAVQKSETAWSRFGVALENAADNVTQALASATQEIAGWGEGALNAAFNANKAAIAQTTLTGSLQDVMPVLAAHLPQIQREIDMHREWAAALDRIRSAQAQQAQQMADLAPEWVKWRQKLVETAVKDEQAKAEAGKQAAGQAAADRARFDDELLSRAIATREEMLVEEVRFASAAEQIEVESALRREAIQRELDAARSNRRLTAAQREAAEEQAARELELVSLQEWHARRAALEAELRDAEQLGAQQGADAGALRIAAAEDEAAAIEAAWERQRAVDDARFASMSATIQQVSAMDASMGRLRGNLTRTLRGSAQMMAAIAHEQKGLVQGQASSVAAIGNVLAAQMSSREAAAGVNAAFATATGFLSLSQHDYWAAGHAFASAAMFGAIAGGAGGGGGSAASAGGGGLGVGGGGMSAAPVNLQQGGAQTIIVQNALFGGGQSLAAAIQGDGDRARRDNLVRSRV